MRTNTTRREFIWQGVAGVSAVAAAPRLWAAPASHELPKRPLGKTGVQVSILGLGGYHLGTIQDDQQAIDFAREAIDLGVTFLDNAWEYHDGRSEDLMGRALQDGYREKVFLMTKHHGRERKVAMQHLEDSLKRLRVDVIDLWQFHEVVYKADPKMIFEQGAIEAAEEARQQGKVRFVGFTGHKDPDIFKDMLSRGYSWDTVQMPINVMDPHYRSFIREILPILTERQIGAIAMKTLGGGHVLQANVVAPEEALRFSWSQPVATLISGMSDRETLHKNVELARNFSPMPEDQQATLLEKTKEFAIVGKYEPFKSTNSFDGPVGRKLHGIA